MRRRKTIPGTTQIALVYAAAGFLAGVETGKVIGGRE